MQIITKLHDRLLAIGIETEYSLNAPWIYLDTVNGKRITENFQGNHGFTVAFSSRPYQLTDRKHIFKTIRNSVES
jgi:hypothetical protein